MISQKEIAKKLGISQSAVSRVLSGAKSALNYRPQLREEILQTAQELGYQHNELARAIRSGKNRVIGVVTQSISNDFTGHILSGVFTSAVENDYFVKVFCINSERNAKKLASQCIGQCLAGVVIYDIVQAEFVSELYDLLAVHNIPLVIAAGSLQRDKGISVLSDTEQGGRVAFEHLYSLGHRSFAIISEFAWTPYARGMQRGFASAAEEAGIALPDQSQYFYDDVLRPRVKAAAKQLIRDGVTACFCTSDFAALSLISQLQALGVGVPEDISVMGRGNLSFCSSMVPGLTTLDEQLGDIGEKATQLLFQQINQGKPSYERILHPHKLVVRKSTQKPAPL